MLIHLANIVQIVLAIGQSQKMCCEFSMWKPHHEQEMMMLIHRYLRKLLEEMTFCLILHIKILIKGGTLSFQIHSQTPSDVLDVIVMILVS